MLYTSGTTGRPKGVTRDMAALAAAPTNAAAAATAASTRLATINSYVPGDDLHLCTGPLYHAAPLAFSLSLPLASGVGIVLMDDWDAQETLRLIEEHNITHTHMVPTMFVRLLKLPDDVRDRYDLTSLRNILHGAAPCPPNVKQSLIDWLGPIVYEYYAATEGAGTVVGPDDWLDHPGTVGLVDPPEPHQDRRRRRQRAAARRGRARLHEGTRRRPLRVLQGRRQDVVRVPGRLLHARRRRLRRRRQLPVPHRPQRQPHHLRRREHLPRRGRRGAARARRGARRGHDRRARPRVGRSGEGGRRAPGRRRAVTRSSRRSSWSSRATASRTTSARAASTSSTRSPRGHRQDLQTQAPRPIPRGRDDRPDRTDSWARFSR